MLNVLLLKVTQRGLKRLNQIPQMVMGVVGGLPLPPIVISQTENNDYRVEDGHHRLLALFLSGKTVLSNQDYVLLYSDRNRITIGNFQNLIDRVSKSSEYQNILTALINIKK